MAKIWERIRKNSYFFNIKCESAPFALTNGALSVIILHTYNPLCLIRVRLAALTELIMEESILKSISEAESRAAQIKAQAQERAAEILAAAEKRAAEISKECGAQCAEYTESGIKAAEEKAQSDYFKAVEKARSEAESYADGILKNTEIYVSEVVGRLTK